MEFKLLDEFNKELLDFRSFQDAQEYFISDDPELAHEDAEIRACTSMFELREVLNRQQGGYKV